MKYKITHINDFDLFFSTGQILKRQLWDNANNFEL